MKATYPSVRLLFINLLAFVGLGVCIYGVGAYALNGDFYINTCLKVVLLFAGISIVTSVYYFRLHLETIGAMLNSWKLEKHEGLFRYLLKRAFGLCAGLIIIYIFLVVSNASNIFYLLLLLLALGMAVFTLIWFLNCKVESEIEAAYQEALV
ncbi:hypothetical protein LJC27_05570 [Christensenellaceae bacterium OttesenSCG-928-M15]|nr:hypothetical protein [Christensenellaceae bacterium OttesenSCG-928-M15]